MNVYTSKQEGDEYTIYKNDNVLVTPQARIVKTKYQALADRLLLDLAKYGEKPTNPLSIVAFHYPMIDFFAEGPRGELENSVSLGLDRGNDWTLECPSAEPNFWMRWVGVFGSPQIQSEEGKKWLTELSLMQLCAVCIIGKVLESVNIPYIVATKLKPSALKFFAKEIVKFYPYVTEKELACYFDNYSFYFNVSSDTPFPVAKQGKTGGRKKTIRNSSVDATEK